MNRVVLSGEVSTYGPRIAWTESGKPQTSLTLVLTKGEYKTFVPLLVVGSKAEEVAETINPGDYVIIEGSLSWRAGRTKEAGKLIVACFEVERIAMSPQDEISPPYEPSPERPECLSDGSEEIVQLEVSQVAKPRKPRAPRQSTYLGKVSALRGA